MQRVVRRKKKLPQKSIRMTRRSRYFGVFSFCELCRSDVKHIAFFSPIVFAVGIYCRKNNRFQNAYTRACFYLFINAYNMIIDSYEFPNWIKFFNIVVRVCVWNNHIVYSDIFHIQTSLLLLLLLQSSIQWRKRTFSLITGNFYWNGPLAIEISYSNV